MSKRKYTHVEELLPEIQVMAKHGVTQRKIEEHYGFESKLVEKSCRSALVRKGKPKGQREKICKGERLSSRLCLLYAQVGVCFLLLADNHRYLSSKQPPFFLPYTIA